MTASSIASSSLSGFVRVTVRAPTGSADLAVPSSVPLAAFLPDLLATVGTGPTRPGHAGWTLCRLDGAVLDPARDLASSGVGEGAVLVVQPAASPAAHRRIDDVVEVIAERVAADAWTVDQRRTVARIAVVVCGAISAAALVRGPGGSGLRTGLCLAVAVLLVLAAAGSARLLADTPTASALVLTAVAFAVGAGLVDGGAGGIWRVGLALVLLAAVLPPAIGRAVDPMACAVGVLGLSAAAGGVLADVGPYGATGAAAIVGPSAVVLGGSAAVALRLARVPRPSLVPPLPDLDEPQLAARTDRATALLTGQVCGSSLTAGVAAVVLAADGSLWASVLAGLLVVAMLVRSHLFAGRRTVGAALAVALATAASVAATLLWTSGATTVALLGTVAGAGSAAAVPTATTAGRWTATPRHRRLVNGAEAGVMAALAPAAMGVWDVYARVQTLAG